MNLSIFVGPEHSVTDYESIPSFPGAVITAITRTSWQWAGGGSYSWSGARSSLAAGFSRRIRDGGGLQGIVHASSASAELRRHLAHRWNADLLFSYDRNQEISVASGTLSYVSLAAGCTRALTARISLEFRYWRTRQLSAGVEPGTYLADHNRVSTSLVYDFKSPLSGQHR